MYISIYDLESIIVQGRPDMYISIYDLESNILQGRPDMYIYQYIRYREHYTARQARHVHISVYTI